MKITTLGKLHDGRANQAYPALIFAQSGGPATGTATWTLVSGTLPAGLALNTNGNLAGTPTTAGTYMFRVKVDISGTAVEKTFTLKVNPAARRRPANQQHGNTRRPPVNRTGGLGWFDFKIKLIATLLGFGAFWNMFAIPALALMDKNLFSSIWKPIALAVGNIAVAIVLVIVITPKDSYMKAKWFGAYKALAFFLAALQLGVTLYAMYLNVWQAVDDKIATLLIGDLWALAGISFVIGVVHFVDWITYKIPVRQ